MQDHVKGIESHPNWKKILKKIQEDRDIGFSEQDAIEIAILLNWDCIGKGSYRGVYRDSVHDEYVYKVALNPVGIDDLLSEVKLLTEVPLVIKEFFLPFNKYGKAYACMPYAIPMDEPNDEELKIMKQRFSLIQEHILLDDCDPEDKPWNWGLYKGLPVVVDFAEWEWNEKLKLKS
jgi:hypothetical protein